MPTFEGQDLLPEGEEESAIYEIIRENNLKNYTITARPGSINGDNYMGAIIAVDINGLNSDTDKYTELHLILKSSNRTGFFVDLIPAKDMFHHEIHMYTKYLPKIYELQKEKKIENGFFPIAKIYKHSDMQGDEFLIMENMKSRGFQMANRLSTFDMDHCELILKQMGYCHALSYTFKSREPKEYEVLTDKMRDHIAVGGFQSDEFMQHLDRMIDKACGTLDADKERDVFEKTKRLKDYAYQSMCDSLYGDSYDQKYAILIHGDCWNNNILFKYNDLNKPSELCFLDWQMARIASPAIDLSYFFYLCLDAEMLQEQFDNLIQIYYSALTEMLAKFELKSEIILPLSVLQDHIKRYSYFGIGNAISSLPMFTSESDEIPEMNKIDKCDEKAMQELFDFQSRNNELYTKRIRAVLFHAVDRKFIN